MWQCTSMLVMLVGWGGQQIFNPLRHFSRKSGKLQEALLQLEALLQMWPTIMLGVLQPALHILKAMQTAMRRSISTPWRLCLSALATQLTSSLIPVSGVRFIARTFY
jgi:hypothetical protein